MTLSALWIYQKERFPLAKTAPLLAVFSAASLCVSAELAGRPLPGPGAFLAGFVIAMALFFQMRVCDECKDLADDRLYRPDRPIPRGLVSLRLIVSLGLATVPVTVLAAWLWHPPVLWLLALVWAWLLAMSFEFGVPDWLKARPVIYLLSHMAIMPLIDLLLTGLEWVPGWRRGAGAVDVPCAVLREWLRAGNRAKALGAGKRDRGRRQLFRPLGAATGRDDLGGHVLVSFGLLLGLAAATGTFLAALILGGAMAGFGLWSAAHYAAAPTPAAQKRMDTVAGLWVFACYAIAGFAPVLAGLL
jgi:hypothetical protein